MFRYSLFGLPLCLLHGIHLHSEPQSHLRQDFLNFVERFLAEILRPQHLPFGLLHQVGDGLDIRILQAVCGADRQLQLIHATEQILVDLALRFIAPKISTPFDPLIGIDKDIHCSRKMPAAVDKASRGEMVPSVQISKVNLS